MHADKIEGVILPLLCSTIIVLQFDNVKNVYSLMVVAVLGNTRHCFGYYNALLVSVDGTEAARKAANGKSTKDCQRRACRGNWTKTLNLECCSCSIVHDTVFCIWSCDHSTACSVN